MDELYRWALPTVTSLLFGLIVIMAKHLFADMKDMRKDVDFLKQEHAKAAGYREGKRRRTQNDTDESPYKE